MQNKEQILFYIKPELKTELKIICAKEKTNITAIITKLIEDYIKEYNRKP